MTHASPCTGARDCTCLSAAQKTGIAKPLASSFACQ